MSRLLYVLVITSLLLVTGCELSKYTNAEVIEYMKSYGDNYRKLGNELESEQKMVTPTGSDSDVEWKLSHKGEDLFHVRLIIVVDDIEQKELEFEVDMRNKTIRGLNDDAEDVMRKFG